MFSDTDECYLLCRLPVELRLRIYEYTLAFERPIRLRQVIQGSPNTAILRASRQIYAEALPVFYEHNTIVAARNDFCHFTDAELRYPPNRGQVRHLSIRNLGHSTRCADPEDPTPEACCDVCRPSPSGFLKEIVELPMLKTAVLEIESAKQMLQLTRCFRGGNLYSDVSHEVSFPKTRAGRTVILPGSVVRSPLPRLIF